MLAKCNAPMLAGLRSVAHLGLSFNAIGCKLPSAACDWRRKALKSKREKHFHALPLVLLAAYGGEQTDDLHGGAKYDIPGEGSNVFPPPIEHPELEDGETSLWIRYCYEGGKLARDGRLLQMRLSPSRRVGGDLLLDCLTQAAVDLQSFAAHAYDPVLQAWTPVTRTCRLNIRAEDAPYLYKDTHTNSHRPPRLDVMLFRSSSRSVNTPLLEGEDASERYFQVGIVGGKTERNVGLLWRSAFQLGASGVFTIGARFLAGSKKERNDKMQRIKQNRGHVMPGDASVPLVNYADWTEFAGGGGRPAGCALVAVEMGGTPLHDFQHPLQAIYLLGAEDTGLPESVIRACDLHVSLPSVRANSFNVAVAGSLVLYDRFVKLSTEPDRMPKET